MVNKKTFHERQIGVESVHLGVSVWKSILLSVSYIDLYSRWRNTDYKAHFSDIEYQWSICVLLPVAAFIYWGSHTGSFVSNSTEKILI